MCCDGFAPTGHEEGELFDLFTFPSLLLLCFLLELGPGCLVSLRGQSRAGRACLAKEIRERSFWDTSGSHAVGFLCVSYLGSSNDQDFPWVCVRSPSALGFWWSWVQGCFSSVEGPVLLLCFGSLKRQWLSNLCVWVSVFIFFVLYVPSSIYWSSVTF